MPGDGAVMNVSANGLPSPAMRLKRAISRSIGRRVVIVELGLRLRRVLLPAARCGKRRVEIVSTSSGNSSNSRAAPPLRFAAEAGHASPACRSENRRAAARRHCRCRCRPLSACATTCRDRLVHLRAELRLVDSSRPLRAAISSSVSVSLRGRLPTWVVRMRSRLRIMIGTPETARAFHSAISAIFAACLAAQLRPNSVDGIMRCVGQRWAAPGPPEHDPEKACPGLDPGWESGFPKGSCSNKMLERNCDSKKSHPALAEEMLDERCSAEPALARAPRSDPARIQFRRRYSQAQSRCRPRRQARLHRSSPRFKHRGWTYADLADRVERFGHVLRTLGLRREERVLLRLLDTIDWPTAFLGAIKAGVVPVPVNTLLTEDDYRFMLEDSRARLLVVSEELLSQIRQGARRVGRAAARDRLRRQHAWPCAIRSAACRRRARSGDRADRPRRHVLLALHLGLDRQAEGRRAHATPI